MVTITNNCYFLLCVLVWFPNYPGIFDKMSFQSFLMGGVYPAGRGFLAQQSRHSHRELPAKTHSPMGRNGGGDPGRGRAWGAEPRGSHRLHLPLGADPRPVAVIKVGPRLFPGCFLGNTGAPQHCPAQAWVQGPRRPPCTPRPPALHHLSPGSQSKHWLRSQERQGEAQSIVCLLFLLLQQTGRGTSLPGAT